RVAFFFSRRRRHTRSKRDWSSDVCSSDLYGKGGVRPWQAEIASGVAEDDRIFAGIGEAERGSPATSDGDSEILGQVPGKADFRIAGAANECAVILIVTPRGFQIQSVEQGEIEVVPEHRNIELDELCR